MQHPSGTADAALKNMTPAEQAFLKKHAGDEAAAVLDALNIETVTGFDAHNEQPNKEFSLQEIASETETLQVVAFFLGSQEFTLPGIVVQEVVQAMPLAKLPSASEFIAGAINLRGRITPIVRLRELLEVNSPRESADKFIAVCKRQGIQIGFAIERVHTMYRIKNSDIDWNIESHFGAGIEHIAGLIKLDGKLLGIVNVDRVIESILKE